MASVRELRPLPDLESPVLVEGLPGVGLVGKIAVDHLIETFEMDHVAAVDCEGLPDVAVYGPNERTVRGPVRLYADADRDILALQSDVPVSRTAASDFAACITTWIDEQGAFPIYLSGLVEENLDVEELPDVFGIGIGEGADRLDEIDLDRPYERGAVGGPTGALLGEAGRRSLPAAGIVVETDPRFPDPAAARRLLVSAVEPLAGVDVPTDELVEHAEDIQDQREVLARRMREAEEAESSQAQPLRGFQ
jgi:uncharacterized protein